MTDICFEKAIQTLYDIQTAESLHLEEQTKNAEISFSENFEKQMKKLIHRREKPYYVLINTTAKRVAVIVLLIIIAFTSTTIGVAKIYQPFADFIMEIFDDHTLFRPNHSTQTSSVDPLAEWKAYTPSYIPEGFEVNNRMTGFEYDFKRYLSKEGHFFIEQCAVYNGHISIDTEGISVEDIYINEIKGIYYENKGENTIILLINNNCITIQGNIDKSELVNIAISLNLEEK